MTGSSLSTREDGGEGWFTVVLNSKPGGDVKIPLSVSSSDQLEGSLVSGGSLVAAYDLTFTSSDWNAAQTVTVRGVDDNKSDGNQVWKVKLDNMTGHSSYTTVNPEDVTLVNIDDDSAGFIVSSGSGQTSEQGGEAYFTLRLTSKPTDDVVLSLKSSDAVSYTHLTLPTICSV